MTGTLVRKLLRDVRLTLPLFGALLLLFQTLWAKITQRITEELLPTLMTEVLRDLDPKVLLQILFKGPGKIIETLAGGGSVNLMQTSDLLTIGYVHPLIQTIFCVWAVGRAAGAVAGEIDRGTMELILAQPLPRSRLILAHLIVDLITIPILVLALWAGNWVGAASFFVDWSAAPRTMRVDPWALLPGVVQAATLLFAVSGLTMWLSARGRSRWRVLGTAVFAALLMFLVNVLAQMWDGIAFLRPLTLFYYYQPQPAILRGDWRVPLDAWNGTNGSVLVPGAAVLVTIGLLGYALALRTFTRRDLPAPL